MDSLIDPKCTGICGALATSSPSGVKIAQEKSSLSLMFTEAAVFSRTVPICSAIFINRLLNISSITGSTLVPIAFCLLSGSIRSRIKSLFDESCALQPGSITIVEACSMIIAGPLISKFIGICSRS